MSDASKYHHYKPISLSTLFFVAGVSGLNYDIKTTLAPIPEPQVEVWQKIKFLLVPQELNRKNIFDDRLFNNDQKYVIRNTHHKR